MPEDESYKAHAFAAFAEVRFVCRTTAEVGQVR
jgi:hypothetical protein